MKLRYSPFWLAVLSLSGCAALTPQGHQVGLARANTPLLSLSAPGLQAHMARAVVYRGQWETEVYQLWRGPHAQAEAIYMHATAPETALRSPRYQFSGLTRDWRMVQAGGPIHWGETAHVIQGHRATFYRPFRLTRSNQDCVAFESDWAPPPADPQQNPGKALFGYYCRSGNAGALGAAEARAIAASIKPPAGVPRPVHGAGYSERALKLARDGRAGAAPAGYGAFPLLWGQMYQIGGGDMEQR